MLHVGVFLINRTGLSAHHGGSPGQTRELPGKSGAYTAYFFKSKLSGPTQRRAKLNVVDTSLRLDGDPAMPRARPCARRFPQRSEVQRRNVLLLI